MPRAADADVIVVNTCSFIEAAKQESIDTILEMAEHKKNGQARRLVVAGCLVERYRDEILREIPEVDFVIGTNELERVVEACESDGAGRCPNIPGTRTFTPSSRRACSPRLLIPPI